MIQIFCIDSSGDYSNFYLIEKEGAQADLYHDCFGDYDLNGLSLKGLIEKVYGGENSKWFLPAANAVETRALFGAAERLSQDRKNPKLELHSLDDKALDFLNKLEKGYSFLIVTGRDCLVVDYRSGRDPAQESPFNDFIRGALEVCVDYKTHRDNTMK